MTNPSGILFHLNLPNLTDLILFFTSKHILLVKEIGVVQQLLHYNIRKQLTSNILETGFGLNRYFGPYMGNYINVNEMYEPYTNIWLELPFKLVCPHEKQSVGIYHYFLEECNHVYMLAISFSLGKIKVSKAKCEPVYICELYYPLWLGNCVHLCLLSKI